MGATFNLADLYEIVVDAIPDRTAVVAGDRRLTYAQLDERANRLAHHLAARGVAADQHVGLQLLNGTEYLEGMLAAFKLRAVPINVNYRYVEGELRYLYEDADLVALIHHEPFAPQVAAASKGLDQLETIIVAGAEYEAALAAAPSHRPDVPGRSGDDVYCAYTGGTTGMPKGVLWRHEDIFFASLGGGDPLQMGNFITEPGELVERLPETGLVALATPPLMHVSAHWLAFVTLFGGGTLVLTPDGRFDPVMVWRLVGAERVNMVIVVGDAMARPLLDELARAAAAGQPYDVSSLFVIGSGGAIMSPSTKDRIAELLPSAIVVDGFGASETGVVGTKSSMAGSGPALGPRFTVNDQTAVLDDDLEPVVPGSGVVGRLARRGHIPIGYYNDPEKTAATFVETGGVRWVLPGDMATVDDDGTVVLLGRGSVSINTGGEKVFPEEVEAALKAHPAVADVVVVGVADERWGERVVAVVQPASGAQPTLDELCAFARDRVAGYKVPRDLVLVDVMERSPSGKADYRWAKTFAAEALGIMSAAPPPDPVPDGAPGAQRDPEWIDKARPVLERYVAYFQPDVRGWENLPPKGEPFLVVGNHSGGQTPPDLPILMTAWWRRRGVDEPVYGLFHSFFLSLPGVGPIVAKAGALEAGHDNAEAVLRRGGVVVVFPGGDHEALRPFKDRNRIDFNGRKGFLRLAIKNQVPIVPCVSAGAHETIVVLTRGERIARILPHMRLMRVKVYPIVLGPPWGVSLGMPNIPLPAQVTVQLCPPIDVPARFAPDAADDDAVLTALYDEVTSSMQAVLDRLAAERRQRSLLDRATGALRSLRGVINAPRSR